MQGGHDAVIVGPCQPHKVQPGGYPRGSPFFPGSAAELSPAGGFSPRWRPLTHHTCPLQMDLHDETYSMPDDVFESPPLSATYLRMHSVGEDARASPEGEQPPL